MNLTEAKKILNNKGYLLEDRFGGGKDRYGHKINRIKVSDLYNEEPDGDTEEVIGGVPAETLKFDWEQLFLDCQEDSFVTKLECYIENFEDFCEQCNLVKQYLGNFIKTGLGINK